MTPRNDVSGLDEDTAPPTIVGILPALVTPMDEAGAIRYDVLPPLIDWLFENGVHGLYLCGTTGEGFLCSLEERERIVETAIRATKGRGRIIVHVGATATHDAIRLGQHAVRAGADAIAAVPPFPYGRNRDGVIAHYRSLGDACNLPLYLYNIPGLTGSELTPDLVREIVELVPSAVGMKFSASNLYDLFRLTRVAENFHILHGCDEMLLYGFMMGAVGGVGSSYNFVPRLFVDMYEAFGSGDWKRANELQLQATLFVETYLTLFPPNPLGLGKALLTRLGFPCGPARLPNPPVPDAAIQAFQDRLIELELLSATLMTR